MVARDVLGQADQQYTKQQWARWVGATVGYALRVAQRDASSELSAAVFAHGDALLSELGKFAGTSTGQDA